MQSDKASKIIVPMERVSDFCGGWVSGALESVSGEGKGFMEELAFRPRFGGRVGIWQVEVVAGSE